MSADYRRWFLLNASPDAAGQIESFPALHPGRGSGADEDGDRAVPLDAVLLTDAELDHTLGLLLLREGRGVTVHATAAVRDTLWDGTSLLRTLVAYCPVDWREVVPDAEVALADGLSYRAFDVPTTKRPRFAPAGDTEGSCGPAGRGAGTGRVVGYRLTDERTSRVLVYLPGVQQLTAALREMIDGCACLLVDGTCWRDDELISLGLAGKTSREMGHLPIDGPDGSLEQLSSLSVERAIYTHMNNTNPILLDDSPERRAVERHGMEVAVDGLELRI